MSTSRRPRRSAAQWQQLVTEQTASGLSAPTFCSQNDLPYASFIQWRRRLSTSKPAKSSVPSSSPVASRFIELTTPPAPTETPERWLIELDLGAGVRLRIAQPG